MNVKAAETIHTQLSVESSFIKTNNSKKTQTSISPIEGANPDYEVTLCLTY